MIQINCMIATPEIKDLASKLGKSIVVTTNAVATWLSENNTPEIPSLTLLKNLFDKAEQEKKDFYLAVPNALTTEYEQGVEPITHVRNKIVMMNLPSVNTLEHFYSLFNIPELRDLVLEPQEAYWFMLWREQQFIVNNWDKTEENILKANQEAINRLKEYKKLNPFSREKLTEEHHTTVKAIDDYITWTKEHVVLDENTHTYYIDGKPADYSVSEYYRSIYGSPDFRDKYIESPTIGNSMDAMYRDYFISSELVTTTQYPNMNESRKLQVLRDLSRFKEYLDSRFGKSLYKVITDPKFHLVAKIGDKIIAGTPDMVVVDKEGNMHIFDMKAKSHSIDYTYNGVPCNDRRDYTAQLNLYRAMMDTIPSTGKTKSLQLIWMDTNITNMRKQGNVFSVNKNTKEVTVTNDKQSIKDLPIADNPEWRTPQLDSVDIEKSIIPLGILPKVLGLIIPKMSLYDDTTPKNKQKTMKQQTTQQQVPASYEGMITPDANTVFVFGSNPEGRHGAGAAKTAREKFGAIYGQGEGLQGNSYALPTKRIKNITPSKSGQMTFSYGTNKRAEVQSSTTFEAIINGERTATTRYSSDGNIDYWKELKVGDIVAFKSADNKGVVYVKITKPLTKLNPSTDAEEWSKKEGWSVDYYNYKVKPKVNAGQAYQMEYEFIDANGERTITSRQITENIKKMYEAARQNPNKQFKVAYTNGLNEATLNGYTGAEMIKMFKDAGPIPSNVMFSKNWTDHWNDVTSEKDTLLNLPQQKAIVPKYVETTSYMPYNRPDISIERAGFTVKETPQAKLAKAFSPIERSVRVEGLARDFSSAIDNAIEALTSQLETQLVEARTNNDVAKTYNIISTLNALKDEKEGRKTAIERYGIMNLFLDVLKGYQDMANMTLEEANATYNGNGLHVIQAAQKVIDNFYPLLDEAMLLVEWHEGVRIIMEDTGDSTTKRGATLGKTQDEMNAEEREFGDDENGNRVNGSEGWSFKIRFIDPHSTVTNRVKKVLANILYQGKNGFETDDLGKPRYLPEVIAYATLANELISLINSDDFAIKDDEGNYTFPALEKMVTKHPWVEQIINELENNPELISQFYAAFRKEFIPYWMQFFENGTRKTNALNRTLAEDNTISDLYAAFNKGIKFSEKSIYTILGRPIKENAVIAKKLIDDVYSILNNFSKGQVPTLASAVGEVTRMLGINVEDSFIESIANSENGESTIRNWANAANYIINEILNDKVAEGEHLIDAFKDQYTNIARTVGRVSETSNVLSFRQKDKAYYSISASNFLYTMIKKFKDPSNKSYIDSEYRQFKWFYNEDFGGWLNGWVEELEAEEETRNQLELREHVFYKDGKGNLKEYNQWTPRDVEEIFFTEYWSIPSNRSTKKQYAMYNMPIFSDSEQAIFIKFSKFSGSHYKDKIIDNLRKVVLQELYRIKLVRDRKAKGTPELMYFDENGLKFQFFPRFNNNGMLEQCIEYIDNKDIDGLNNFLRQSIREEMNLQFIEYLKASKLDQNSVKDFLVQEGIMKAKEDVLPYIEEYYWNNAYAQTQILQLTIIDPAFYKNGNDLQKRFKEIIASGTKLFTNSKYGRKTEYTIYLKDLIGVSSTYTNIKEVLDKAVEEKRIGTYDRDNILHLFREVNATDAQAYRTTSSYRAVIDMLQGWSPEMERAFNNFKKGIWDMSDFNIVWQTIKPFMYTHIAKNDGLGGKIKVGHQNKNSEFLLLAMYDLVSQSMGKSEIIQGLNEFMENQGIDVAQFISAVKTGGEGVVDITYYPGALDAIKYDDEGNITTKWSKLEDIVINELGKNKVSKMSDIDIYKTGLELQLVNRTITQDEYNKSISDIEPTKEEVIEMLQQQVLNEDGSFKEHVVHELPYEDYVVQQPTPEHVFDVESIFGSQFRNLLTSDLPDDFTLTIGGKTLNKQQVLRLYQGCIVENLLENYKDLSKEFQDINSLQKMLLSQIKGNSKYGKDIINALQIIEIPDPLDESKTIKTFNIPLNSPNITDILQELLLSYFKNNITKQYIKGGACIAVSNFGFTNELRIHYNKEGDKTSGIKYMDCYLPWYSKKYFEPFIKRTTKTIEVEGKKKTVTYEELDYTKLPEDLKKAIGLRIPTEDKYSMFPLRIAGFLPIQNGSSIMLPMEATTISGMDFKL